MQGREMREISPVVVMLSIRRKETSDDDMALDVDGTQRSSFQAPRSRASGDAKRVTLMSWSAMLSEPFSSSQHGSQRSARPISRSIDLTSQPATARRLTLSCLGNRPSCY